MADSMVFFVLMQQEVCTLSKPSSAGLVLNTFSCRNLTAQQANYFFGMWPFHYRERKSEPCYPCYKMTCWQCRRPCWDWCIDQLGKNPITVENECLHVSGPGGSIKNVYRVTNSMRKRRVRSRKAQQNCLTYHANFLISGNILWGTRYWIFRFLSAGWREQHIDTALKMCPWMTSLSTLAFVLDKQAHYWMT